MNVAHERSIHRHKSESRVVAQASEKGSVATAVYDWVPQDGGQLAMAAGEEYAVVRGGGNADWIELDGPAGATG